MRVEDRSHAARSAVTGATALAIAALFGAPTLDQWAQRQSDGAPRRVASAAVVPAVAVARAAGLFALRESLARALFPEALPEFSASEDSLSRRVEATHPESMRPASTSVRPALAPNLAPDTPDAQERRYSAARPLTVWVAGDSMAYQVGLQLARFARPIGAIRVALDAQASTGLLDRGAWRWLPRLGQTLEQRRPHVFVLSFGANDADALPFRGVVYGPGRPEWREGYRERVRAMMTFLSARRPVYWLGMPVMRNPSFSAKMATINAVFAEEAARAPGVTFVPTWSRYAGADGQFAAFLPDALGRLRPAREADGVHYTPAGARMLAAHLLDALCERFVVDRCGR
jgi:hypothetical protein